MTGKYDKLLPVCTGIVVLSLIDIKISLVEEEMMSK